MNNIINLDGVALDDEEIKKRLRCPGTIDLSQSNFDVVVDTGPVTPETSMMDDMRAMKERADAILAERGLNLRFTLGFLSDGEVMKQLEHLANRTKPEE